MSIQSQIERLQGLRNTLRTKLIALGLVSSNAKLEDCIEAVDDMPNRGAVSQTLDTATTSYAIPAGYHNGNGQVNIVLEEKTATPTATAIDITPSTGKVLSKVTINPIPGNLADVSGVTAVEADVLATKLFVKANGLQAAGTMPNNGAVSANINGLSVTEYTIPAGYHNGSGKVQLTNDIETALAAI